MTDSFMHYHQAALDSQREEAEINWLFPEPDNDDILERLFEEAYEEIKENNILQLDEDDLIFAAKTRAERRFEELPEPGDYDD
tara:strand:- start:766 stop:1014 length:249 start_codon:yes stop_codon:yes gene_type:complete